MIEDYAVKLRTGRAVGTGIYELTRNGKRREKTVFKIEYTTKTGIFGVEEWKEKAMQEIEKCGETDLLEKVKEHCREHCAWLRTEKDVTEYAISCTCSRAYEYWDDFEENKVICWM